MDFKITKLFSFCCHTIEVLTDQCMVQSRLALSSPVEAKTGSQSQVLQILTLEAQSIPTSAIYMYHYKKQP